MKKFTITLLAAILLLTGCVFSVTGCGTAGANGEVNVFNWGEYIDEDLLGEFEDQTGIKVNYSTVATCEEMYAKLKNGGVSYDVIVPSDYMVARMIEEEMIQPLDFSKIPNYKYVDEEFREPEFDPTGEYSVPYQWGSVGIIYNKAMVDEADLGSWDILWNEKYAGQILMFDNSRDAMGIALKKLGYSYNTTDEAKLMEAKDLLIQQKPLVQAYVMDQIFDKMENGEAAVASYYAGDYLLMMDELGEDSEIELGFYTPIEGSNLFVDSMVVPKDCENYDNAMAFINFICEPENMARNTEVIYYSTAESAARDLLPEELKNSTILYPDEEIRSTLETYTNLPETIRALYDELWVDIMSA